MPWLSPDRYVDACGPLSAGLAEPYAERGGEDALGAALDDDPRRCVALVGDPGSGTSRLALELSRAAGGPAFYPHPVEGADWRELDAVLGELAPDAAPRVVLDGPDRRESLASFADLLARRLHPRLKVIVPADPGLARRLSRIGGEYPRGSILVATVGAEATAPPPVEGDARELLPLLLGGRLPAEVAGTLADTWCERGLAARAPDGDVVTLVPERARNAWLDRELLAHDRGAERLSEALGAAPAIRAAALETLLWLTDGAPPASLLAIAAETDAASFPDPRALWARGVPVAPPVTATLIARARSLLEGGPERAEATRVNASLAALFRLTGDRDAEAAALDRAIETAEPRRAAVLRVELAGTRRDPMLARQAAGSFDDDDLGGRALGLRQLVTLLHAAGDLPGALAAADEWIAIEERAGRVAAAAAARARAARLATEYDEDGRALALLRAASDDRRAIGDTRGLCASLHRVAGLLADLRRTDEAEEVLREALAVDERVDEPSGVGYCAWMLGALADKRGDAAEAARRYAASMDAYARLGRVPDRLVASLARARAHAEGADHVTEETGEGVAMPELPSEPGPEERLVELRVKSDT